MKHTKIDEMYAWVATDPEDNTEGVIAFGQGEGAFPLVGADLERAASLRPYAEKCAKATGQTVTLCHFKQRVEVDRIEA